MKQKNKDKIMNLLVVVFVIYAAVSVPYMLWSVFHTTDVSFSCDIGNIEYTNVSPYQCWFDTAPEFCPLPKDVSCSFGVDDTNAWRVKKVFDMLE